MSRNSYRYRLKLNMEEQEEGFLICQLARNRIAAVCDFLTYCRYLWFHLGTFLQMNCIFIMAFLPRYIMQGMVKSSTNDVYWEVMRLRRTMACARLGFES